MHESYQVEDTSAYEGVIYALHTGDHEYRYIGKTVQPLMVRFGRHLYDAQQGINRPVCNWIMKHGPENIQACVLSTFDEDSIQWIDDRERFYISQYREITEKGLLNLTDGGDGRSPGYTPSEETKAKMSAAKIGQPKSVDHRAKISASTMGRVHSQEHREKISQSCKGKPRSEEAKLKLAEGAHKRWHVRRGIVKPECSFCIPE